MELNQITAKQMVLEMLRDGKTADEVRSLMKMYGASDTELDFLFRDLELELEERWRRARRIGLRGK